MLILPPLQASCSVPTAPGEALLLLKCDFTTYHRKNKQHDSVHFEHAKQAMDDFKTEHIYKYIARTCQQEEV